MTEEERLELVEFLKSLEVLLMLVVFRRREMLPDYLHPMLETTWGEVAPNFAVVAEGIPGGESDRELEGAGLTGASLSLKMTGFRQSFSAFLANQIPRLLLNVLKWANIALKSLATIFNAAEPIKEFKEAMEAGVEERRQR